jgi:hypothetical protein
MLRDSFICSLKTGKWEYLVASGSKLGTLAYHTAIPVFYAEQEASPTFGLHYTPSVDVTSYIRSETIKEVGVYVFGGLNKSGETTNKLRILKTG